MISFSFFPRGQVRWVLMCLLLSGVCQAKSSPVPVKTIVVAPTEKGTTPVLDTAAVRKLYLDGDFDQAIEILEHGLKSNVVFSQRDSVFIFKHLGVMYAAKYETREKGKYYMHQLLTVEPTARIMDMYASDMIYMIFKNIQDEYEETRGKLGRAQSHVAGNSQLGPTGDSATNRPEKKHVRPEPSDHKVFYWVGGTAVAVAVGVGVYFILADRPGTETGHTVP